MEYKSTRASIHRPSEKVFWPSDGDLVITLTNPCLLNEGLVTFDSQLIEYDVCQNETEIGANFTFTDTISTLSSITNYCGNPVVRAVFVETYNQDVTDPFTLYSFAENNTGYITYDLRMCDRSLARSDPY